MRPTKTFDLRQETTTQSLIRGVVAATATKDTLVQIIADTPFKPGTEIEFIMHRAPLTQALRELDGPDAWMTLIVASVVGLALYLALLVLLVRPMRRLTSSISAFRADPEHGVPLDPRTVTGRRDDEISAAGRELAAMQRELRAALWRNTRLAALGTVVAKVSHDVRGVLTPVLLQADRLRKHSDPAVRRAGDALVQAVERAIDLVHRTLDFARDGPPPPLFAPIRLRGLVAEAAESVRSAVALFELDNRIPTDLEVEADRNHLYRVLANLLRNAAEAGAGHVRARIWENGDTLAIELADDGPGLPEAVRANLFRPFTSTRRAGGSGLGLAIARDLMLAHGGDIGLVDTGPGGTTFRLTLKVAEHADRVPQAADFGVGCWHGRRCRRRVRTAARCTAKRAEIAEEADLALLASRMVYSTRDPRWIFAWVDRAAGTHYGCVRTEPPPSAIARRCVSAMGSEGGIDVALAVASAAADLPGRHPWIVPRRRRRCRHAVRDRAADVRRGGHLRAGAGEVALRPPRRRAALTWRCPRCRSLAQRPAPPTPSVPPPGGTRRSICASPTSACARPSICWARCR